MTHAEKFIEELLRLAGDGGFLARVRLGMGLIRREARAYFQKRPAKHLPVTGFHPSLIANGQQGEVYRHLRFHIGCELISPIGWPMGWLAEQLDIRQFRAGRAESASELAGNAAARTCGIILSRYMTHHLYSKSQARTEMRSVIASAL